MSLPCIRSLQQLRHSLFPVRRGSCHCVLESLVKAGRVRERSGITEGEHHIAQIVDCHARSDDEDVVVSEVRDCLAQTVVLNGVLGFEQRYLDDGDV